MMFVKVMETVGLFLQQRQYYYGLARSDLNKILCMTSLSPGYASPLNPTQFRLAGLLLTTHYSMYFLCNSVPERSTTLTYFPVEKDPR